MKTIILAFILFFVKLNSQSLDTTIMENSFYMNTFRGYLDVTSKITEDGYKYVDENRLINPKPMNFDYKEILWLKENLYDFVKKSYSGLSKDALDGMKTISIEDIKSRPYIFTGYSRTFDEDVYLLKIKNKDNEIYNVYMIKYQTMEGVYKDDKIIDHELVKKVRFENEEWYRNFFNSEDDYNKNRYSQSTPSLHKNSSERKYNTLADNDKIYKTFEGKDYTYEEWKHFENEQYKIYMDEKNKKGFWDNLFG